MREMSPWAHKIASSNLPYLDGFHECITAASQGQLFFSTLFGTLAGLVTLL